MNALISSVMMNRHLETMTIRPHLFQFVINELKWLVLLTGGILYGGIEDAPFNTLACGATLVLALYLIYNFIYLWRCVFYITDEQIIYKRGVFTRRSDFIELYRIVDFKENCSFLQQLSGLKTVVIYSGDRTTPELPIWGVNHRVGLVTFIRERVEYNKQKKGIYEITNR